MKVIGVVWVNTAFVSETFVKFKKADTDRASKDKGTPLGFAVSVSRFSSCGRCAWCAEWILWCAECRRADVCPRPCRSSSRARRRLWLRPTRACIRRRRRSRSRACSRVSTTRRRKSSTRRRSSTTCSASPSPPRSRQRASTAGRSTEPAVPSCVSPLWTVCVRDIPPAFSWLFVLFTCPLLSSLCLSFSLLFPSLSFSLPLPPSLGVYLEYSTHTLMALRAFSPLWTRAPLTVSQQPLAHSAWGWPSGVSLAAAWARPRSPFALNLQYEIRIFFEKDKQFFFILHFSPQKQR